MKKFFSLVLALVMAMSLTTAAWGASMNPCTGTCAHEAAIGDTHYDTVEEAVAAATAGQTVKMLTDATVETSLVVSGITLDGNGKTLIADAALGGMTEVDNDNMATIRTTGGTIKNLTVKGGWKGILYKVPTTDLLLEKVTVVESARGLNVTGASASAKLTVKNSTLGGWISAESLGAVVFENTTFVANASGRGNGLNPRSNTTLTNCTANAGVKLVTEDLESAEAITVDGGTYACDLVKDGDGTFVVKAGTFTDDVSEYVADGKQLLANGTVVPTPAAGTTSPTLYAWDNDAVEWIIYYIATGMDMDDLKQDASDNCLPCYLIDDIYFVETAEANAIAKLVYGSKTVFLTPVDSSKVYYTDEASVLKVVDKDDAECGDWFVSSAIYDDDDVYYISYNKKGDTVDGIWLKVKNGSEQILVGGKIVDVEEADYVDFMDHDWAGYEIVNYEYTSVKCEECDKVAKLYTNATAAGKKAVPVLGGWITYADATDFGAKAPATTDKVVESAQTFDAGIAMYVGMSVLAATGSAVVLKKKH